MTNDLTTSPTIYCYKCKKELDLAANQKVSRSEECESCYANVHCCKMCRFYDSTAYNDCREPSAPRVVEKEKANYCDYFRLRSSSQEKINDEALNALNAANSLFKN